MEKYVSARYIQEKIWPIKNLISIVEEEYSNGNSDNLSNKISDYQRKEFAYACAIIAKELGVNIPDV